MTLPQSVNFNRSQTKLSMKNSQYSITSRTLVVRSCVCGKTRNQSQFPCLIIRESFLLCCPCRTDTDMQVVPSFQLTWCFSQVLQFKKQTVDLVWLKLKYKNICIYSFLHEFPWLWVKKIMHFLRWICSQTQNSSSRMHSRIYIQAPKTNLATGTVNHYVCLSVPPSSLKEIKSWNRKNEKLTIY